MAPLIWRMLLANSSVSGKAATGHVLMYAPTGGFPRILALHPKALRQIGNLWFFKTNSEIVGIALLRSNGRKGRQPLLWLAARAALALHPKSLRQIGEALVFRTNSGSVYEPLMWEVRFLFGGLRGGDRSIGGANLRKGAALQWKRHCRPPSLFIQNGFARLVALRAIRAVLTPAG